MSEQAAFCAECGTRRHEGTAFCMECGTPFPTGPGAAAPPPVPPPYAATPPVQPMQPMPPVRPVQQTQPATPSGRGRTAGVALLVLLLLAGVGTAGWWLLSRDGDPASASSRATSSNETETAETAEIEETDDAEPSVEASPSDEPTVEPKTCWDGVPVERLADCRPLGGVDGLRFVFPSMDANFDRCRENVPSEGKVRAWSCRTKLADGEKVSIVYSEWQSQALMTEHYFAKFTSPPTQEGSMYFWGVSQRPLSYQASGMFITRYPYSFSVVAPTFAEAEEGLGFVEARPARELPKR